MWHFSIFLRPLFYLKSLLLMHIHIHTHEREHILFNFKFYFFSIHFEPYTVWLHIYFTVSHTHLLISLSRFFFLCVFSFLFVSFVSLIRSIVTCLTKVSIFELSIKIVCFRCSLNDKNVGSWKHKVSFFRFVFRCQHVSQTRKSENESENEIER